ncbi:MAG TPA: HK97 family phage prohead protease, partial [Acidimicrobiales bacterium]
FTPRPVIMGTVSALEVLHRRTEAKYRSRRVITEHQARRTLTTAARPRPLVRHDGGGITLTRDGDTFMGLAAPFNRMTQVRERFHIFDEVIMPGAFTRSLRVRPAVPILVDHDPRLVVGESVRLLEAPDGLRVAFSVDDRSLAARLADIRDGSRVGLSIGFRPVRERHTPAKDRSFGRDLVEQLELDLHEISVVRRPAYAQAALRPAA